MQKMQIQIYLLALIFGISILYIEAQTGPFPPRLSIPGAVPIPSSPSSPQFRNEKLIRVRRPIALRPQNRILPSTIAPNLVEEKPVTEPAEEETPDAFLPQFLREQQLAQVQQAQFQQTAAAFLNGEHNSILDAHAPLVNLQVYDEGPPSSRQPDHSQPSLHRPAFNDFGIGRFAGLERPNPIPARPTESAPASQRVNVVRSRPVLREPRPQYEAQIPSVPPPPQSTKPTPSRPRPKPIQSRPILENQLNDERDLFQRRQKPVAQTLRKWRDENEDGSITWGYENDDGSFKEEFIGKDCITKGTYGYVDPDGNKREYHYETGIKCDPNTRESEDVQEDGFINYEENKAVLPNGLEIDMSQLGKKKSKRPNTNIRNQ